MKSLLFRVASKSLLFRVASFALVLGLSLEGTEALYERRLSRSAAARERLYDEAASHGVVFFGDSHIACDIDDTSDLRIFNIASPNEFFVLTGAKVRRVHPKVAVVGVWIHNFLPFFQENLGKVALSRYDVWAGALTREERGDLLTPLGFEDRAYLLARSLLPVLGTCMSTEVAGPREGLGGYVGEDRPLRQIPTPGDASRRLEIMTGTKGEWPLPLQARGLERVLQECDAAGRQVVLLSTPVMGALRQQVPPGLMGRYQEILSRLGQRHRFVLWDESAMALPPDHFYDPDHLSEKGAVLFTRAVLRKLRRDGLLGARDERLGAKAQEGAGETDAPSDGRQK